MNFLRDNSLKYATLFFTSIAPIAAAYAETLAHPLSDEVPPLDLSSISPPSSQELKLPSPSLTPPTKSPALSATLSTLVPGLGHVYLGDLRTAGEIFGTSALGASLLFSRFDASRPAGALLFQTAWFYGIYAAYRDARVFNGNTQLLPNDSLGDLTYAPFNWKVLKKPAVWGGLLGALGVAAGVTYFAYSSETSASAAHRPLTLSPLAAFPIGLSEEAFFRGYLQSQLLQASRPSIAITLSSLAFGAAHITNAAFLPAEEQWRYYTFSLPFITGLGGYLGWLTYKNQSLKESVALHAWYDFTLFALGAWAKSRVEESEASTLRRPSSFVVAFPF